jgi:hypothetical protein
MLCRRGLILAILSLLLVCALTATTSPNSSSTIQKMNQMPLPFTKNMGQWDERILFRANAGGTTMWFTREGVTYQFTRNVDARSGAVSTPGESVDQTFMSDPGQAGAPILPRDRYGKDSVEQLVLTTKFVGAMANPEVVGEGLMEYKCNYFIGNDPSKWHTDVPNYEAITLKDVYPGIDLKYSGDGNGQAAYEFLVAPGADIAQIKIAYEGAEKTSFDTDASLILQTTWGNMTAGIKSPADGVLSGLASFSQVSEQTVGFQASSASRQTLSNVAVGLIYSTFVGGGSSSLDIAIDENGNSYVTGFADRDVFVTKLSNNGNSLIYTTYLGGGNEDEGESVAVDGNGNAYVTGVTWSPNFPTVNPYQGTSQGHYVDAFVAKLSSAGNSLIYSTYLGGGSEEYGFDIAVDGNGHAYVTGFTLSADFPTLNSFQATFQGTADVFVTKFSSTGSSLIYSTYLGGENSEYGFGIAVDGSGNAYVTGFTDSYNFPTLNPYQGTFQGGPGDAFVAKLSSTGNSLIYSTYLGGESGNERGYGIAVDDSGYAYVTGVTNSVLNDFPTQNAYQPTNHGVNDDAFVTKLSVAGNSLIFSTYLGGGRYELAWDIAVDGSGNAYVTGQTWSADFPTLNPYQTYQGLVEHSDVFVTKLNGSGNSLIYSTYLGGGWDDIGQSIAVDGSGNAYVTGVAGSGFPALNLNQTYPGQGGVFVTKLSEFQYLCGDANADAAADISDVVYLTAYIFSGGSAPLPYLAGDANYDSAVDISDAVYLIAYIFSGGPAPGLGGK